MTTPTAAPTAPVRVTPDDLLRMPDGDRYELIDGALKERTVSLRSTYVASEVAFELKRFCRETNAGWVFGEGASFRCFPFDGDRVRRADVAFIALGRLSVAQYEAVGHCPVAPDLVVEVVSPHDRSEEVDVKVEEWLAAGVKLVWLVSPAARNVRVYDADGSLRRLREADSLSGNGLLPGLTIPVGGLFRVPAAG